MEESTGTPMHPEEEQDDYAFMQEVIKEDTLGKRIRRDIFRIAGKGFLLGLVACFSFVAFKPWVENRMEKAPEQITIPREEVEHEQNEEVNSAAAEPETMEVVNEVTSADIIRTLSLTLAKAEKSVVEIGSSPEQEMGTGVIFADNGKELLILGEPFEDKNAKGIQVVFPDKEAYEAVVKRQDKNLGLCVYAVARDTIKEESWGKISNAALGSSNLCAVDDVVIAVGHPFGRDRAVGYGLISSVDKVHAAADGNYHMIETNLMSLYNGSGVILSEKGEIVAVISPESDRGENGEIRGYGITGIKRVVEILSNGGGVPYVGVRCGDITDDMISQGFPPGISVKEVVTDSPAMTAGIQSGDVIVSMDGEDVTSTDEYNTKLMEKTEGGNLQIVAKRQGTGGEYVDIEFSVIVGTMEE